MCKKQEFVPKISVIIPVYNVEKYIEACCRSLFEQTLDDVEFIFIDDCSRDLSIEILESTLKEYPNCKERVTIIRNYRNLGPSESRNIGLEHACGQYVTFCDSDDIVEKDTYRQMFAVAQETQLDMVSCGIYIDDQDTSKQLLFDDHIRLLGDGLLDIGTLEGALYSSLWNKIFRRDFLICNNIRFNHNLKMWDDLYFTFQARYFCKKELILNIPLYHYRVQRCDSLTSEDKLVKSKSQIECVKLLIDFIASENRMDDFVLVVNFLMLRSKDNLFCREYINRWRFIFPESHKYIFHYYKFYGFARILRYYIVAWGGSVGWNILDFYSGLKQMIVKKK